SPPGSPHTLGRQPVSGSGFGNESATILSRVACGTLLHTMTKLLPRVVNPLNSSRWRLRRLHQSILLPASHSIYVNNWLNNCRQEPNRAAFAQRSSVIRPDIQGAAEAKTKRGGVSDRPDIAAARSGCIDRFGLDGVADRRRRRALDQIYAGYFWWRSVLSPDRRKHQLGPERR